ncbi:hypothetical protein NBRC116601_03220 [Cognatishimia sp. WU-CL00825]
MKVTSDEVTWLKISPVLTAVYIDLGGRATSLILRHTQFLASIDFSD